jgi:hypothetical protein
MIDLIYCSDGNARFAQIAIDHGFLYGAQLPPRGIHFWPWFADQNWKSPCRKTYMSELDKHRPFMASVLDWERLDQFDEVLGWAEDAAQFAQVVMIIPKVIGETHRIPRWIGGRPVRLGYSVPTKFGGTSVPIWEFYGRSVHLLGGSPDKQMELARYLNVVSADGNYAGLKARKWCEHWTPGGWVADGGRTATDAIYTAFEQSCRNIMAAWQGQIIRSWPI